MLHVHAQVDDLDAVGAHDRGHDVFAEVVDVVLDGAEHQGAVATLDGALEFFLQGGAGLLEDVGGVDELGEVVLALLEALAHDAHAGLQFFQDGEGGLALGELVLDQRDRLVFF